MNKQLIAEINTCPFCHSKLVKSPSRCFSCGGERIYGYIPPTQRKIIILLRIILIAIMLFYFFRLLPVYNDHVILIPLFIISVFSSFFIPSTYYKIKYRNNVIWKKKPLLWQQFLWFNKKVNLVSLIKSEQSTASSLSLSTLYF